MGERGRSRCGGGVITIAAVGDLADCGLSDDACVRG